MGANYDLLIVCCDVVEDAVDDVGRLLGSVRRLESVGDLDSADLVDDKVILVSPPCNGWIQVVANCGSLGYSFVDWFDNNPLGIQFSEPGRKCIHAWTLDSGFVAGYAVYENGRKSECGVVFDKTARSTDALMPGVPVPTHQGGPVLGRVLGQPDYDFETDLRAAASLEDRMARIVSRFGFATHLIDFCEATDDKVGIAILEDKYVSVPLSGWTVMRFR